MFLETARLQNLKRRTNISWDKVLRERAEHEARIAREQRRMELGYEPEPEEYHDET